MHRGVGKFLLALLVGFSTIAFVKMKRPFPSISRPGYLCQNRKEFGRVYFHLRLFIPYRRQSLEPSLEADVP